MPEGDTIARAAVTLRARVAGHRVIAARPAALARLAGRTLESVSATGKHLYMHFGDGLVLHTHMRMTGSWHVYAPGQPWRRAPHRATAVLDFDGVSVVLFAAPVCELVPEARVGAGLGPDILAGELDIAGVPARARGSSRPTLAELLLDQSVSAGIGNIYRCEALWHERVDPCAPPRQLDDATVERVFRRVRDLMRRSVTGDGFAAPAAVHGRAGRPCPRCGVAVVKRPLGMPSRILYWCPRCQPPIPGAPLRPPAAPSG